MNSDEKPNVLQQIRDLMAHFSEEVGNFLGLSLTKKTPIDRLLEQQNYVLQFERATVNVDFIANNHTHRMFVKGFDIR